MSEIVRFPRAYRGPSPEPWSPADQLELWPNLPAPPPRRDPKALLAEIAAGLDAVAGHLDAAAAHFEALQVGFVLLQEHKVAP
jgi:hypothetical protein